MCVCLSKIEFLSDICKAVIIIIIIIMFIGQQEVWHLINTLQTLTVSEGEGIGRRHYQYGAFLVLDQVILVGTH